ncbi:MAG: hypothetical protein WCX61_04205 [Candidatus Peribacteraceae bacterium]
MTNYNFKGTIEVHVLLPMHVPIKLSFSDGSHFEIISADTEGVGPESSPKYGFRIGDIKAASEKEAFLLTEEHLSTAAGYLSSFLQFRVNRKIEQMCYFENGKPVTALSPITAYLNNGPFPVKEIKIAELVKGWNDMPTDPALIEAMRQLADAKISEDKVRKFWHLYISCLLLAGGGANERECIHQLLQPVGVAQLSKISRNPLYTETKSSAVVIRDYFSHSEDILTIDGEKPNLEELLQKHVFKLQYAISQIVRERVIGLKSDDILIKL